MKKTPSKDALLSYTFELDGDMVVINALDENKQILHNVRFPLSYIFWGGRITIYIPVQEENFHRFLWFHQMSHEEFKYTGEYAAKGDADAVMCAFTNTSRDALYLYLFTTPEQIYKKFIHISTKHAKVYLSKNKLYLKFWGSIYTEKIRDFTIKDVRIVIDAYHKIPIDIPLQQKKNSYKRIQKCVSLSSLIKQETEINNPIHVEFEVNGTTISYNIGCKDKKIKQTKFYYIPVSGVYYQDFAMFIRRNINANYVLVIRKKEPIETSKEFRKLEAKWRSFFMYTIGKIEKRIHRKKVNLYFEKNAEKADEGTWQIFEAALRSENSNNYFVLDKNSQAWENLPTQKNVVKKYSKKYYKLLYSCDCFISTETSSHLNVHRAMNPYIRRALLERSLIFLQHGVTYLKRQGSTSVFGKGKEGEPTYMIVGSEKESKVVCKMLGISQKQCVKTGLPIFDTIDYEHITENSEDVITIMLTWKPSEEHMLEHFEESSYYKKTIALYNLVSKYILAGRIQIVPHPKVLPLLLHTDIQEKVCQCSVAEALRNTKILITDYSSVCYNAFYQGAGIIFFQPDLAEYEAEIGKLIPKEDEYIGWRGFDIESFDRYFKAGIINGCISLPYFRTPEHKQRYMEINEFCDGENVNRIVNFLREKEII